MEYDPIKHHLAELLGRSDGLRRLFFIALDLLFLRAWYIRRELKRLHKEFNLQHPVILDAGMGFGQYSDRMLRIFPGSRLVGLEIDRGHLYNSEEYFRRIHPGSSIVLGDVQRIPLGEAKFDLILTVDVMEHIIDDAATFAEYGRTLKPGGLLVMHTPRIVAESNDGTRTPENEKQIATDSRWQVDEHVRDGYRDDEARERLEAAGMEVVRMIRGYATSGMVAWNLLQRVPLSLLGRSRALLVPVALYLIAAFPVALVAMWLDLAGGDHPRGGSLLVVARKPERGGR